jgi:hypothetical protein
MIAERAFAARVLERVDAREAARRRHTPFLPVLPLVAILIVGGSWAIAIFDGATTLRWLIEGLAWLSAFGRLEQHLSTALLGPFAPLPLVVSLLLFVAAIGWVRVHQPDDPEPPR